ncbi:hypothetical protein RCC89_02065 [Cytophagaceae bacterium ABcell3]|nr:hypothetical protein RCC89_02065 [Cytophagaceae bacterium ABcell3]
MRKLLLALILLMNTLVAEAKNDTIFLVHNYNPSLGLQLKWLPADFGVFKEGLENGYDIYRAEVLVNYDGEKAGDFIKLNNAPIRLWPEDKLIKEEQNDSSLAIAGIFINGLGEIVNRDFPTNTREALEKAQSDEIVHLIGLFSAISNNKVAEAIGLYFNDKSYEPAKKYLYKINIHGQDENASIILVFPFRDRPKAKVMDFKAKLQPGSVHLSWFNAGNRDYPYYNIYRSHKKKGKYVKLNQLPFTGNHGNANIKQQVTSYTDSFPDYNKTYYYKVVGVNAFEEEGTPSDIQEVTTHYLLKTAPAINDAESPDNENIKLSWAIDKEDHPYIKGFSVIRAPNGDGPFKKVHNGLLPAHISSFVDGTSKSSSNYYKVVAHGHSGDSIASFVKMHLLVDSIPPAQPEILSGICDTNGVVTLKWKQNTEADLEGYRVFRSYDLNYEPVRVLEGHTADSVLIDSIGLERPYSKVYYRIVALDHHFNPSTPSDFYEIVLPDNLPPSSGYLKNYSVGTKGISLEWQPSNSYDLKKVYLMRKGELDFDYKPVLELEGENLHKTKYTDTTVQAGVKYSYALMSEDESGLKSDLSKKLQAQASNIKKIATVTNLQVFSSRSNKMVKLTWDFPQNAKGFRIYRARNGGDLVTYKFVKGTKREFYDKMVKPRSKYTYMIVAELNGGYSSAGSEKIEVKY